MAAEVIAWMPVRRVGSGGFERLVWKPEEFCAGRLWLQRISWVSIAPSQNMTVGILWPSNPKRPKSSLACRWVVGQVLRTQRVGDARLDSCGQERDRYMSGRGFVVQHR